MLPRCDATSTGPAPQGDPGRPLQPFVIGRIEQGEGLPRLGGLAHLRIVRGPQLEEAARTLGQTPLMAFLRITLPIISPAIGAGFVLVFLDTMKELTATLVLGPTGLSTLATSVWVHTANLEYAAAAPYAALLILISGLPVYLLTTRAHLSTH